MNLPRLARVGWLLVGWACALPAAHAGTVDWSAGAAALTLADQTSLAATGSLVQIGYFTISDAELATGTNSLTRLADSFVPLQAAVVGVGAAGNPGIWTTTFSGDFIVTNAAFAGRNVYLWTLDAPQLAGATQTSICKFDARFPTDEFPLDTIDVDLGDVFPPAAAGTVLVGTLGTGTVSTALGDLPHVNMAPIFAAPPPAPVANFSASPTVVLVGVPVSFTDLSTGTITNHLWAFGDNQTSALPSPSHGYLTAGVYSVSLTVAGPGGSSSTNFPSLITVTSNSGPAIVTAPFLTNAVLQTGALHVAPTGAPTVFHAAAVDPNGDPVTYLWDFGDGATGSGAFASHTYTNCDPVEVTLAVTDGTTTNTSTLTVTVPCPATVTSLQLKSKFSGPKGDSVKLGLALELPPTFVFAGTALLLDVGGAQDTVVLGTKRSGVGTFGKYKVKFDTKAQVWRLTAALKGGTWHDDWAAFGLANATISKTAPATVNVPVVLLIDAAAYLDEPALTYTATLNKNGTAKK